MHYLVYLNSLTVTPLTVVNVSEKCLKDQSWVKVYFFQYIGWVITSNYTVFTIKPTPDRFMEPGETLYMLAKVTTSGQYWCWIKISSGPTSVHRSIGGSEPTVWLSHLENHHFSKWSIHMVDTTQVKLPTQAAQFKVLKVVKIPKRKNLVGDGSCNNHCTPLDCAMNTINNEYNLPRWSLGLC